MARTVSSDPLMVANFAVLDVPVPAALPIAFPGKLLQSAIQNGTLLGFQRIQMPRLSIETKKIKEGNWGPIHTVSTGFTDGGEVTLEHALMPLNVDMWFWFQQAIWGRHAPRRDLLILHMRNDRALPVRITQLEGCIPTAWSPADELSGDASKVLMESLTLSVHRVNIVPLPVPAAIPGVPSK